MPERYLRSGAVCFADPVVAAVASWQASSSGQRRRQKSEMKLLPSQSRKEGEPQPLIPTFALWFWNQTCTTRTLSPVSAASVSRTLGEGMTVTYSAFWGTLGGDKVTRASPCPASRMSPEAKGG